MKYIKLIGFSFFFILFSCDEEDEFFYNLDLLCEVSWGIPFVQSQGSESYTDLSSPTIFHKDGTFNIGNQYFDLWRVYDSKSIVLENKAELWLIIELNDSVLHVSKNSFPRGDFIAECIYNPD